MKPIFFSRVVVFSTALAIATSTACGSTGLEGWPVPYDDATTDRTDSSGDPAPDVPLDWPADSIPEPTPDLPPDFPFDPPVDTMPDPIPDSVPDPIADTAWDSAVDPVTDTPVDFPFDPPFDSPPDWPFDPPFDSPPDTPFDRPPDLPFDTGYDTGADVPYDSGPTGVVGAACGDDSDCMGVPSSERMCVTDIYGLVTLPGGYCTAPCTSSSDCGSLGRCVDVFSFGSYCLRACTTSSSCRVPEGYSCSTLPGTTGTYCLPPLPGPDGGGPVDY